MIKFKITDVGTGKLYEYNSINSNTITMEEKILTMLGGGLGYSPSTIHRNMIKDKAVKTRNCTEGTVLTTLKEMESEGMVSSYDDSNIERTNGGVINGNN